MWHTAEHFHRKSTARNLKLSVMMKTVGNCLSVLCMYLCPFLYAFIGQRICVLWFLIKDFCCIGDGLCCVGKDTSVVIFSFLCHWEAQRIGSVLSNCPKMLQLRSVVMMDQHARALQELLAQKLMPWPHIYTNKCTCSSRVYISSNREAWLTL